MQGHAARKVVLAVACPIPGPDVLARRFVTGEGPTVELVALTCEPLGVRIAAE